MPVSRCSWTRVGPRSVASQLPNTVLIFMYGSSQRDLPTETTNRTFPPRCQKILRCEMSGADVIDKDRFDGISMGAVAQTVSVTPAEPGLWERYVRPAHPERSNPRWHVSPVIDIAAYHFSWVWVLIPMMLVSRDSTILVIYALVLGANMAHRHYGMPYAYLDPGVFRSFERKLTYFPEICILLFAATPLLLSLKGNAAIAGKAVAAIVFFAALWNIWHTLMQKFGIMRLYRAKDPAAVQERTPGWIDKYLILCWLPLYLTYAGPKY